MPPPSLRPLLADLPEPMRGRCRAVAEVLEELRRRIAQGPDSGQAIQSRGLEALAFVQGLASSSDPRWQPIREAALPTAPLLAFVDGLLAERLRPQVRTWAEFHQHARLTVLAPGQLFARALGVAPEALEAHRVQLEAVAGRWALAEALGSLAEDRTAGRVRIPAEELAAHGLAPEKLYSRNPDEKIREFVRYLAARADGEAEAIALLPSLFARGPGRQVAQKAIGQQFALIRRARSSPEALLVAPEPAPWWRRFLKKA